MAKPREQHEAESALGEQIGQLLVSAVASSALLPHVGPALQGLSNSASFQKALMAALRKGLVPGVDGVVARAEMSANLNRVADMVSLDATRFAAANHKKGNEAKLKMLETMMETSKSFRRASKALGDPIEANVAELVVDGRRKVEEQKQVQEQWAVQQAVEMMESDCNDPNCKVHVKH